MSTGSQEQPTLRVIWARSLAVWAAMLLLLLVAAVTAYIPLGPFNVPIMLVCAAVEVVLVGTFGMELVSSGALYRLAAVAGVLWLVIMFALTLSDVLTRST
jgi:cytochrome c oxidase subunit 4